MKIYNRNYSYIDISNIDKSKHIKGNPVKTNKGVLYTRVSSKREYFICPKCNKSVVKLFYNGTEFGCKTCFKVNAKYKDYTCKAKRYGFRMLQILERLEYPLTENDFIMILDKYAQIPQHIMEYKPVRPKGMRTKYFDNISLKFTWFRMKCLEEKCNNLMKLFYNSMGR